jgi:hypothetical protein|tara:strand:+ start:2186 stop:2842 length:657 start_codon:yes stop_codon:yes gene_type:complete
MLINLENVTLFQDPFPHLQVDDFFMPEVWEKLRLIPQYMKESPEWNPMIEEITHGEQERIFNNVERLIEWGVPKDIADLYYQATHEVIERRQEIWEYMPDHREYEDIGYDISQNVNYTLKGKHYGAHVDDPMKCMSLVCYLDPEHSSGTALHPTRVTKDGKWTNDAPCKTIEWKRNRCLIFNPSSRSWHSYTCETEDRFVFAMFMFNKKDPKLTKKYS